MRENNAIWFLIGAEHGPAIFLMVGIAIAMFAVFGTLFFIWASLPK